MGAEGFGGWLRIWVPLIKLEGNCGGRGVWGLITKVSVNIVDIPFFGWGSEYHERFSENNVASMFSMNMQPLFSYLLNL